jgi:hypothetical protein
MSGPVIKPMHNRGVDNFRRRMRKVVMPDKVRKMVQELSDADRDSILVSLQKHFPILNDEVNFYNYNARY